MAIILVQEVQFAAVPLALVRAFALDAPRARTQGQEEAVEFTGWVLGRAGPVVAVEVRTGDRLIARLPIIHWRRDVATDYPDAPASERSGFKERVDLSSVTPEFELQLTAILADDTPVPLATIRGRRRTNPVMLAGPLAPSPSTPRWQPAAGDSEASVHGDSVVMPRCSVVVPVHNRATLTGQCLDALLVYRRGDPSFEVIVVDDASTDETPGLLASYGHRLRVVTLPANRGFAAACNAGAAVARGDYLVFLNNDTVPQPGWLAALARYADLHPVAAVVGAKLLYPDDTVQHAGVVFGLDRYPHHLYAGFPEDHPAVNTSRRFRAVTAACCLVRRGAFAAVGGFDRAYVNGWEDTDLCLRLGERGYEVHYCHESTVYHLESASRNQQSHSERNNRDLYSRRWRDRVEPDGLRYYLEDGLLQLVISGPLYPLRLELSPLLATAVVDEKELERALAERTEQVAHLQRAIADLHERLQLAEMRTREATEPALAGDRSGVAS